MYLETVDMSDFEYEDMICPPKEQPEQEAQAEELARLRRKEMKHIIREERNRSAALSLLYSSLLGLDNASSREDANRQCDEAAGMLKVCLKLHYLSQAGNEKYRAYIEGKRR